MKKEIFVAVLACVFVSSCASSTDRVRVREVDPGTQLESSGVGIESKDIAVMSAAMTKDLLRADFHASFETAPNIVIDNQRFINESSEIINMNLLTDRIRINLIKNARGKFNFLSRENYDLLIEEAKTSGQEFEVIAADFRLVGRLSSISSVSPGTGIKTNYYQIAFEILDLSNSVLVWADIYEIKKTGADDTIYR